MIVAAFIFATVFCAFGALIVIIGLLEAGGAMNEPAKPIAGIIMALVGAFLIVVGYNIPGEAKEQQVCEDAGGYYVKYSCYEPLIEKNLAK